MDVNQNKSNDSVGFYTSHGCEPCGIFLSRHVYNGCKHVAIRYKLIQLQINNYKPVEWGCSEGQKYNNRCIHRMIERIRLPHSEIIHRLRRHLI